MRYFFLTIAALFFAAVPAQAEWWEAKTDHFLVFSQSNGKDAKQFAEDLERFDGALRSLQGMEDEGPLSDSRRLTIYRFGDIGDMSILYGSPDARVGGFYIPRAMGPVAFSPAKEDLRRQSQIDALRVLFHEYGHHFMFRHFTAAYPSWYIEAFAELNSTIELEDDGSFKLGAPPKGRGEALAGGLNYSIKKLLLNSNRPEYADQLARYTYGWLLLHYLTFDPQRKGQLQNYLKLINSGKSASEAAPLAFGDLDRLETDVNRYRAKNRYPGAMVQTGKTDAPQVALRRLGDDEEAIMRVRIRSDRGVDRKSAKDVAGDARNVAARYPASLPVLLALIEAEYDADELDRSEKAADAALAINPNAVKALLYKGMIHLKRAKTNAAHYEEARSWLGKANRADQGHPAPLLYFYKTYQQQNIAVPDLAVRGLERAFQLAPYDTDLRVLAARQMLIERNGPLARRLLHPLAHAPHESKRAKALNEVAELIEAGKLDEALAKLESRLREEEQQAQR